MLVYGSPSIIDAARHLLRKPGAKLSVVVEDALDLDEGQEAADHPLIAAIQMEADRGWMRGEFEVKVLEANDPFESHFIVMDHQAYRIETDDDQARAVVNFGNSETAELAAKVFESLSENSRQIIALAA